MSSPFAITTTTNTVSLDERRRGQTSFTVSNSSKSVIRGHANIVAQPSSAASWLTLLDEAERSFAGAGSQQYAVQIAIPANAKAGEYTFQLNVSDLANPDENFSEGPTVRFTVEESTAPQKKPFPWWIVVAIIGALILLGGGVYSLSRVSQKAPSAVASAPANATLTPQATAVKVPRWLRVTPMPTARYGLATVLGPDGRIYAIGGGVPGRGALATLEAYDPVKNSWTSLAPMPTARYGLAAVLGPDGRIYAIGGYGPSTGFLHTVESYDTSTNTWTTLAPMPTARYGLAAVLGSDGYIYAMGGGSNTGLLSTVEAYNTSTNSWTGKGAMLTPRMFFAATSGPDGHIYAMGGYGPGGAPLKSTEVYDPGANSWTAVAPLPTPTILLTAVAGPDGRIYVIGGAGPNNVALQTVEIYDPTTNSWTPPR